MIASDKLYKSILQKLNVAPIHVLKQIDVFLQKITTNKPSNLNVKQKTLAFAGSWSDMKDEDFNDFLKKSKQSSEDAFSREIDF